MVRPRLPGGDPGDLTPKIVLDPWGLVGEGQTGWNPLSISEWGGYATVSLFLLPTNHVCASCSLRVLAWKPGQCFQGGTGPRGTWVTPGACRLGAGGGLLRSLPTPAWHLLMHLLVLHSAVPRNLCQLAGAPPHTSLTSWGSHCPPTSQPLLTPARLRALPMPCTLPKRPRVPGPTGSLHQAAPRLTGAPGPWHSSRTDPRDCCPVLSLLGPQCPRQACSSTTAW